MADVGRKTSDATVKVIAGGVIAVGFAGVELPMGGLAAAGDGAFVFIHGSEFGKFRAEIFSEFLPGGEVAPQRL